LREKSPFKTRLGYLGSLLEYLTISKKEELEGLKKTYMTRSSLPSAGELE
jgi:hypothetical protein